MKAKIFKHLALILIILTVVSVSSKAAPIMENKTIEISLPTIQCGICVKNIEKALNRVEGVLNTKVNLENKKAIVTYDDSKTTIKKIEKAITKAGYDANNRKANKEAYGKLMGCCKLPEDRK
jgi:mercuric ion binding protein